MLGLSASSAADEKRSELESIEAAIERLPKAKESPVSQGTITQERADRLASLSAALSSRIPFDRLLRQIALVLPEDAWLTGLKASTPSSLAPATPAGTAPSAAPADGVTIQGATYSHTSVARVLSRLAVVPTLSGVRLTASALVEQVELPGQTPGAKPVAPAKNGKKLVTFTITASLRTGGSP
jgi:Tfp pilus assembly protein PilN